MPVDADQIRMVLDFSVTAMGYDISFSDFVNGINSACDSLMECYSEDEQPEALQVIAQYIFDYLFSGEVHVAPTPLLHFCTQAILEEKINPQYITPKVLCAAILKSDARQFWQNCAQLAHRISALLATKTEPEQQAFADFLNLPRILNQSFFYRLILLRPEILDLVSARITDEQYRQIEVELNRFIYVHLLEDNPELVANILIFRLATMSREDRDRHRIIPTAGQPNTNSFMVVRDLFDLLAAAYPFLNLSVEFKSAVAMEFNKKLMGYKALRDRFTEEYSPGNNAMHSSGTPGIGPTPGQTGIITDTWMLLAERCDLVKPGRPVAGKPKHS